MTNKSAGYTLSALALAFAGVSTHLEAQRYGGGRSSGFGSMSSRSTNSSSRSTYSSSRSAYSPSRSGYHSFESPSSSRAAISARSPLSAPAAVAARRATINTSVRFTTHPETAAQRVGRSGVPLTAYTRFRANGSGSGIRPPTFNRGGNGGGGNNGGNGNDGHGGYNNGGNGRRPQNLSSGYAPYRSGNSSNILHQYVLYSLLFNHHATYQPARNAPGASTQQNIDMSCAIDHLKASTKFRNATREKLVNMINAPSQEVRDIIAPCLQ